MTESSSSTGPPGQLPSLQLADLCELDDTLRNLPFTYWELTLQPVWLVTLISTALTLLSFGMNWWLLETKSGRSWHKYWHSWTTCAPKHQEEDATQRQLELQRKRQREAEEEEDPEDSTVGVHVRHGPPPGLVDRLAVEAHDAISSDPTVKWALMPPTASMTFQVFVQTGHIIYIGLTLHPDQSHWHLYEELYCRIFNGGAASFMLPFLFTRFDGEARASREGGATAAHYCLNLYYAFLLPPLVTHGCLVYVFFPLIILITSIIVVSSHRSWLESLTRKCGEFRPGVLILLIALNITITLLIQCSMNYGIMFYGGHNYLSLMWWEYELRSSECYRRAIAHSVTPMVVSFASLF